MYEKLVNYAAKQLELDPAEITPCRFCRFLCQRVQARATSAGKDHCHNFFCHSFILPFYTFPDLLDLEMV